MPQIWLTYDELASLFECEPGNARAMVIGMRLDRRRSRDGNTRVKLNKTLTELFFERVLAHAAPPVWDIALRDPRGISAANPSKVDFLSTST